MKRIIICEGKTDAILISYFLMKKFGWIYTKGIVIDLPLDRDNQTLKWYTHQDKPYQELAIFGVGGINQIPIKLSEIIDRTSHEIKSENRFERIVLFFDRADLKNDECLKLVKGWINNSAIRLNSALKIGRWVRSSMTLKSMPTQSHNIKILPIVLPPNGRGDLETFLLNSIEKHSNVNKLLVKKARKFIEGLPDSPYLHKRRHRPKACLGSVLSVFSPDWVFSELNDRLTRINWEDLNSAAAIYDKLREL